MVAIVLESSLISSAMDSTLDEGFTKADYFSTMVFFFIYYYKTVLLHFFKWKFYFWLLFNLLFLKAAFRLEVMSVCIYHTHVCIWEFILINYIYIIIHIVYINYV